MPRKPRFNLVGIPQHVIQRGHNSEPYFYSEHNTPGSDPSAGSNSLQIRLGKEIRLLKLIFGVDFVNKFVNKDAKLRV